MIERLNRTYKASYRTINGFDNYNGANYDLALWAAYYKLPAPAQTHQLCSTQQSGHAGQCRKYAGQMVAAYLPRSTDHLKSTKKCHHYLFLDSEPEVIT